MNTYRVSTALFILSVFIILFGFSAGFLLIFVVTIGGLEKYFFGSIMIVTSLFMPLIFFMRLHLNKTALEVYLFNKKINQIPYNHIYSIGSQTFFFFQKMNEIVWLHKNGRLILFFLLWLHRNKEFIQELIVKVKENPSENASFPGPLPKMDKRILWTRWGGDNTQFRQ